MSFIIGILIFAVVSFISTLIELAIISISKLKLAYDIRVKKDARAERYFNLLNNPFTIYGVATLTNNIANEMISINFAKFLEYSGVSSTLTTMLFTTVFTIFTLIFIESLPKMMASRRPRSYMDSMGDLYFRFFGVIYRPFLAILNMMFGRIYQGTGNYWENISFEKDDVKYLSAKLKWKKRELRTVQAVLQFAHLPIKEYVVPLEQVSGVFLRDSIDVVIAKFVESRKSKLMIFDKDRTDVVGYLTIYSAIHSKQTGEPWQDALHSLNVLTEESTLLNVYRQIRDSHAIFFAVFNSQKSLVGMITAIDITAIFVGEMKDEFDLN